MRKPQPPTPPRPRTTIKRVSTRPELPHGCSIPDCESPRWKKGGRVGADQVPELCPMHYHRELRASPDALEPGTVRGGVVRKLVGFRPSDEVLEALKAWHAEALKLYPKISQGNLVERAVEEALRKRGHLAPLKTTIKT